MPQNQNQNGSGSNMPTQQTCLRNKHAYAIEKPKLILCTYIGHSGFEAQSKLINCVLWLKDPASIYRG